MSSSLNRDLEGEETFFKNVFICCFTDVRAFSSQFRCTTTTGTGEASSTTKDEATNAPSSSDGSANYRMNKLTFLHYLFIAFRNAWLIKTNLSRQPITRLVQFPCVTVEY